jgi:nitrogen-specific signal transduction histidine kinase
MAVGNPVIAYIDHELRERYAPDLPIIQADKGNIEEVLKNLIENRKSLAEIGANSRKYAKRIHHSKVNARKLIEIYNSI